MTTSYPETWDLDVFFQGGSHSPQFAAHLEKTSGYVKALQKFVQQITVPQNASDTKEIEEALEHVKIVRQHISQAGAYLSCLTAQNIKDNKAMQLLGELSALSAESTQAFQKLRLLIGQIDSATFEQLLETESLSPFAFLLTEWREASKELLSEEEEALIATLSVDGYKAWDQLYDLLISDIRIEVEIDGVVQSLSVGQANNLSAHQDSKVRKSAFEAIEKVFTEREEFFAKTLNHIAGFRLNVYKKRDWNNVLKEPLTINRMKEETLDAMWGAIAERKETFTRYLTHKAQMLGDEKLNWYDFDAPVSKATAKMDYQEGAAFILKHFGRFSKQLEAFSRTAFEEGWIEVENRDNKKPGGFCTSFPLHKQSRIFMTYSGTMSNVATLAHELGHAFHTYALRPVHPLNTGYAMNVAETASTFAEMIVADAAVQEATTKEEKIALIEDKVQRSVAFFMNIHARFLFETRFYEERKTGIVSSQRLSELMEEAQREAHGDALGETHPHFWATKLHFFITGVPFYNFPYTFGYLFSLSIYAKAQEAGTDFEDSYISLLQDTAVMSVEDLALKHLGEDITKRDFWLKGIALCERDVEQFIMLTSEE